MNKQSGSEKKKTMSKEKRFYLFTAIGCAVTLVAIILVAVLVTNKNTVSDPTLNDTGVQSAPTQETPKEENPSVDVGGNEEPVVNTPQEMILPLESVSITNHYGFYHNQTLNNYYEHKGLDFSATVGAEVLAANDGVVESITQNDVLTGTEIVLDHGDGVKTVYRFVTANEGLEVGAKVKRGDVIATVAEATGEEYKDGAHLHFEIKENGKHVDPANHLTFEEK